MILKIRKFWYVIDIYHNKSILEFRITEFIYISKIGIEINKYSIVMIVFI